MEEEIIENLKGTLSEESTVKILKWCFLSKMVSSLCYSVAIIISASLCLDFLRYML